MDKEIGDINSDICGVIRDGAETVSEMEPMLIEEGSPRRKVLTDLALELAKKSAGFHKSLPIQMIPALARLVRSMNCYYSNLIEGHNTHPVEIERALKNEYSGDQKRRNLQQEAKAHIEVQQWIDAGNLYGHSTTITGIREVHRRFCEQLPDELLCAEDPDTHKGIRVVPGELRRADVKVGQLVAISPGAVPRFLQRFEAVYSELGLTESILAAAAAHHRLVWMHPFLDGNGRVARLMSHATLLETLDTGALWSIARGLSRRVDDYKRLLVACDQPRRNHLDGRGNLSAEALIEFTDFFLRTCIDQVSFMERLMEPTELRTRTLLWVEEQARLRKLSPKAAIVLEAILYRGEVPRGEIHQILNTGVRQAQRIAADLVKMNVITSETPLSPFRISFPAELAPRWMPGLFPPEQLAHNVDAYIKEG